MTKAHRHACGFSLVELMTSMVIGSIILLLAATMLRSSGDGYERIGGGVSAEREARALISQLGSDLSTARFQKDVLFSKSDRAWQSDRIGFLTMQPAEAQSKEGRIGDLCAVNYYLKDLTIGGKTTRVLMRGFRESDETFRALREETVPRLFDARDSIDEPIAFGVVSFEARPKSRDKDGKWIDWSPSPTMAVPPEVVDLRIIVARRDFAGRLRRPADWDGDGGPGAVLGPPAEAHRNPNLEIYSSRIRFGRHEIPTS